MSEHASNHESKAAAKAAAALVARNVERTRKMEEWTAARRTFADRIAERVAAFCGDVRFVWVHAALFAVWIGWNTIPGFHHFDPYPFTFLTMCVSLEAIFLSAFILISQNYELRLSERRAQLDLQINLLAEQENTKTLYLLQKIARKLQVLDDEDDPEIEALAAAIRPEMIGKLIERRD